MEASNAINSESDFTSPTADEILKKKWEREQNELKKKLLLEDVDDWSKFRITADVAEQFPKKSYLKYVGGVDLSFIKGDDINACAAFVVLKLPELKVIYQDLSMVQLTAPYVPGFLAFREVNSLQDKIDKLKNTQPDILPQVILVDGNGILHPRGFGLACHLGVLTNLPTIGIAKNLLCVDGIERDDKFKQKIQTLQNAGDCLPLIGLSGKQHGMAYRSCKETSNPIYISPGHKISMDTAIWVVQKCIKYRIPEPTRQADILSREYIRSLFDKEGNVKKPSTRKKKSGKAEKRNERGEAKHSEMSDDDDESCFDSGINLWDS